MPIRLHNTLTRAVEPLTAADPDGVFRMYCCGPTVWGPAHIGNFRTFIIQDVLRRALEIEFGRQRVLHARNVTDVDDKTVRQSQAESRTLTEFTAHWTERFHEDCAKLNALPPHHEPTAVGTIPEQIELIRQLFARGHAYQGGDGSAYFKVSSFPEYGRLSHLDMEELRTQEANSAGQVNSADEYSRESVADFALWKARKPEDGPNFWPSPWGEGRPGWHIECSAMIEKIFGGKTLDLHGAAVDLVFPHHENEIAQSCCAHEGQPGYQFVRHWFHNAHLVVDGRKMSKSLGNLYTLDDIEKMGFAPVVLRYALIAGHYRSPLNFTKHGLESAQSALHKLDKHLRALALRAAGSEDKAAAALARLKTLEPAALRWGRFAAAWAVLCDDLNIPGTLGEIFKVEPKAATAEQALEDTEGLIKIAVCALGLELPLTAAKPEIDAGAVALAEERKKAKEEKNFPRADELRKKIEELGYLVRDNKGGGYELEKKQGG